MIGVLVKTYGREFRRGNSPPLLTAARRIPKVLRDTEIEGVPVKAGSRIMVRSAAVNRGAPLARLELAVVFRAVARYARAIEIDQRGGGVRHKPSVMNMGLEYLHLGIRSVP